MKIRRPFAFHSSSESIPKYVASSRFYRSLIVPINEPIEETIIWTKKTSNICLLVIFMMFDVL